MNAKLTLQALKLKLDNLKYPFWKIDKLHESLRMRGTEHLFVVLGQESEGKEPSYVLAENLEPWDADFILAAQKMMPLLIEAAECLSESADLISNAMTNHIYDEDNGEKPGEDCQYQAHLVRLNDLKAKLGMK